MITTEEIFQEPKLRSNVHIAPNLSGIALEYREQSCDLEVGEEHLNAMADFLAVLSIGGKTMSALRDAKYCGVSLDTNTLIEELDRLGLITESKFDVIDQVISGDQLYREVIRVAQRTKRHSQSKFFNMLLSGNASRKQIIGYALEYYHVVRLAPGLIGPALSISTTRKSQRILQEFLKSELFHDRMLESSLKAVGINASELEYLQPLPGTFAICSSLGVFAKQHPLSFYSALFLFEEPYPEFNEALVNACKNVGIEEGFYRPIIQHASINDEFGHDDISKQLLDGVGAVSSEDVVVTKKNISILVEMFLRQEKDIISYYGNDDFPLLRTFN